MPVALKGATSGQVTLDVPAAAGTNTLTLPAKTGNIITSADSGTVTGTMLAASTVTQNNLASNVAGNGPAFSAYQSSAQTYSNATYNKVQFQTKEYDTASCFDNSTNYRFTPNTAGYYYFSAGATLPTASRGGEAQLLFYKNGSQEKSTNDITASSTFSISGSALIYCNGTTDYVETYLYTATGGTTAILTKVTTWFQAFLARSA